MKHPASKAMLCTEQVLHLSVLILKGGLQNTVHRRTWELNA